MTRNNLGTHLSWLLQNAAHLSRPTPVVFPPARDPSAPGHSLSQLEAGGSASQPQVASGRVQVRGPRRVTWEGPVPLQQQASVPASIITAADEPPDLDDCFVVEEEILAEAEAMTKLAITSKAQRPSLLLKSQQQRTQPSCQQLQQQLPTPAPTSGPRSLQQAYEASIKRQDVLQKRHPHSSPTRRRDHKLSTASPTIEDDVDDSYFLDLTANDDAIARNLKSSSSDGPEWDIYTPLWTGSHTKRPEPVPKAISKKRKSEEMSKTEPVEDEDLYPDIHLLMQASSPPPSSARRAAKVSRTATASLRRTPTDTAMIEERTITETISRTERLVQPVSDGSCGGTTPISLDRQTRGKTPAKLGSSAEFSSPSKRPRGSQDKKSALLADAQGRSSEWSKRTKSRVIQDSDDEFMTPPSHNSTALVLSPSGTKPNLLSKDEGSDGIVAAMLDIQTPTRASRSGENDSALAAVTGSARPLSRKTSVPSLEPSAKGSVARSSQQSRAEPKLASLALKHGAALRFRRDQIDQDLNKNRLEFEEALRECWPKEDREQVKNARPPILAQRQAIDDASDKLESYKSLCAQKESLIKELSHAYTDDLDTGKLEAQLDELDVELRELEEAIHKSIVLAGIPNASFFEAFQTTSPNKPPGRVILSTQVSGRSAPSGQDPHDSKRQANTDIIHQTQLPTAGLTSYVPSTMARGSVIVDDQELFVQPFPRGLVSGGSAAILSQSHEYSTSRPSPLRRQRQAGQDVFSDCDDDDMLAAVQDCELTFTGRASQTRRPALSQTSGNAVLKKREPSSSKPAIPEELMNHPWSSEVRRALKDRFRMSGFRTNQLEAINATLSGHDAFVLMPTGGGKSLCYQLPAVITKGKTRGLTIVISPLLSLMQDQVDHLKALNILARAFNGEMNAAERREVMSNLEGPHPEHHVQLLYVTPEMVNNSQNFRQGMHTLHRNKKLARIVIDEAHCVSQWGHDFRPDYTALGGIRRQFPGVPVMALTATATQNVIIDIKHNLGMERCRVFSQSFNRANLYYEVREKSRNVTEVIGELISARYAGQTGIVYTLSRNQAESVAESLSAQGIRAAPYHAKLETAVKTRTQANWQKGRIKVVVATIAFGMGIDKPDVRFVIHHSIPKSLEGYYQETGRAGRDGKDSDCILFFGRQDIVTLKKMIYDSDGGEEQKNRQLDMLHRVAAFCENRFECRRATILRYFGESFDKASCNKSCDNCKSEAKFEQRDVTDIAVAVIRVAGREKSLTMSQCADILIGKPGKRAHSSFDELGIAKALQKNEVQQIIDLLQLNGALGEDHIINGKGFPIQYLKVGRNARAYLSGRQRLLMSIDVGGPTKKAATRKPRATKKSTKKADRGDGVMPSTMLTSPARPAQRSRSRKAKAVALDDEDDEESDMDDGSYQLDTRGYSKDGFVLSDGDEEDDGFGPPPNPKRARNSARNVGPPIQDDALLNLSDVHQDIVYAFLEQAKAKEEEVRNAKGLRKPLFSEQQLREMVMRWTTTIDKMAAIPSIDMDKVRDYGREFLPLVREFHQRYKEMMGGKLPGTGQGSGARAGASDDVDVVDLLSSDDDLKVENFFDDDDDDEQDEQSHDMLGLGSSKYFDKQTLIERPPAGQRGNAAQNSAFSRMGGRPPAAAVSSSRATGSGAKRSFVRKASGGSYPRKASGGITKRRGGGGARKTSGGSFNGSGGRSGKGGGGRSGGGSSIALMPF